MSRSAFNKANAAFFDPLHNNGQRPYDFSPPPASPTGPHQDWTLKVKNEGYARPPVDVTFIGTISHEKPDPYLSKGEQEKRQQEIDDQAKQNDIVLKKAVFILSQSATGRDVLEQMTKEGYRIVFDDRRTGDRGAGGLCDPSDKTLILRSHDNPEYLALLIGHEAVHAVQNTRHDLFPSTKHRPEVGIKMSFAIEADAYAQQSQIALELAYGDPTGPADQIKFQGPLEQMRQRFPDIIRAAEKVLSHPDALQNGASVAAAFQAFYDNFHLRTFYEDAHLEWANTYAPKLKGTFPWLQRHFSKGVNGDWIKDRIQHRGLPYLNIHAPHLSFDDARHSGVSDVSAEKIKKFYEEHVGKKPPVIKSFGVHMKDAIRWVLGLSGSTSVVFKKGIPPANANASKPPLRAPPRRKWGFWE